MLKINGIHWGVYLCSTNDPILRKSNGDYAVGVCDSYEHNIYISNDLPESFTKKVLCHEIVHASIYSYGIILDYWQEEMVADLFCTYGPEIICLTNKITNEKREDNC